MFKSKKALLQEIKQLKGRIAKLEELEFKSAVIEEANLPKCESRVCFLCAHAAISSDHFGNQFLVGCTKELKCKDFILAQ